MSEQARDVADQIGDAVADATETTEMPVNVYETDDAVVVVGACPGVMADDVTASVDDSTLVVESRVRSAAPKDYLLREWEYGGRSRTLDLPVDAGLPATASLGNGQLAISLTKGSSESGEIEIGSS